MDLRYEHVRLHAWPCQWSVRGITSSVPVVDLVQVAADPNPIPRIRLWSRRRG